MSEIVPAFAPTPPPGWYPDTTGHQRWWDGTAWGAYAPVTPYPPTVNHPPAPHYGPGTVVVRAQKEVGIAYLFAIFLGGFGAHHFYVGNVGAGIGFVLLWWVGIATSVFVVGIFLLAAAFVWLIIDLFLIPGYVRNANARIWAGR